MTMWVTKSQNFKELFLFLLLLLFVAFFAVKNWVFVLNAPVVVS